MVIDERERDRRWHAFFFQESDFEKENTDYSAKGDGIYSSFIERFELLTTSI